MSEARREKQMPSGLLEACSEAEQHALGERSGELLLVAGAANKERVMPCA